QTSANANTDTISVDDDPLNVKQLALNFDYLIYKINDRIKSLAEETELSVSNKRYNVEVFIEDEIQSEVVKFKDLNDQLDELLNDFLKVQQIDMIVKDFKQRI
ncbi:Cnl1p ASCRUDRAFT_24961, partial [Ascoidea rubescens DSM 1968]